LSIFAHFFERGPYFLSGTQLTSGRLYHYAAGTTTLQDTWTTRDKTSTQAQPIVGDANGIFSGYADGIYKFTLVGPVGDDTVYYTWDNVNLIDPPISGEGAALSSASTLTLGTDGNFFHVTGTTTITAISGTQGRVSLLFEDILTLTNGATLVLNGGVNHTTQANDILEFLNDGGGVWRQVFLPLLAEVVDDIKVKKALPRLRLLDTTDGQEYDITTGLADFAVQENTGTEGTPVWTDRLRYDKATTTWVLTGDLSVSADLTVTGNNPVHGHTTAALGGIMTGNAAAGYDATFTSSNVDTSLINTTATATITTLTGAKVLIVATAHLTTGTPGAGDTLFFNITRGGSSIVRTLLNGLGGGTVTDIGVSCCGIDTPSAASNTWEVSVNASGNNNSTITLEEVHLAVMTIA
jgi:hypothetical protein